MKINDDPMMEAIRALASLYPDPDRGRVVELVRQNEAERAARREYVIVLDAITPRGRVETRPMPDVAP